MRNRWLVNLLLLILVIVLGATIRRELEQERQVVTLTGLLPKDITRISVERSDKPSIRLVRKTDGWRMVAPYQVAANARRIGELVGIAATPVYRSLLAERGAERLGLNADSLRLTLDGLVMRFGDVDPVAHHRYVAIGEHTHLIGDGFHHHLMASAEDYVSRSLLQAGFRPAVGTLDGVPLASAQLTELDDLVAERVEPLGSVLTGRLLSLTSEDGKQSLRFLVSADGLRWSRLDLRLRYLLTAPPAWAVAKHLAPRAEAEGPLTDEPNR